MTESILWTRWEQERSMEKEVFLQEATFVMDAFGGRVHCIVNDVFIGYAWCWETLTSHGDYTRLLRCFSTHLMDRMYKWFVWSTAKNQMVVLYSVNVQCFMMIHSSFQVTRWICYNPTIHLEPPPKSRSTAVHLKISCIEGSGFEH